TGKTQGSQIFSKLRGKGRAIAPFLFSPACVGAPPSNRQLVKTGNALKVGFLFFPVTLHEASKTFLSVFPEKVSPQNVSKVLLTHPPPPSTLPARRPTRPSRAITRRHCQRQTHLTP